MNQSKGLKALKEIQIKYGCNVSLYDDVDKFELIEKELKALEIIKNIPDNYKEGLQYTFQHLLVARKINQAEYDLLKETLITLP